MDGVLVPVGSSVRYLGLVLDAGWTFRDHFDRLLTRADRMVAALSRLMPNLGGRRRQLYAGVVHSVIMYGAPVWADIIVKDRKIRQRLWAIQRRISLRVIYAYRTVSWDAAAILAGLVPGDILAECYRRTYFELRRVREVNPDLTARARSEIRKRERRLALEEWLALLRDRGELESGHRVREALIPNFMEWIDGGGRGGLTFRATQTITGHGSFGDYLERISSVGSLVWGGGGRWTRLSIPSKSVPSGPSLGGSWSIRSVKTFDWARCLGSPRPNKWSALLNFAEAVMAAKETAECVRQAEAAAVAALASRHRRGVAVGGVHQSRTAIVNIVNT